MMGQTQVQQLERAFNRNEAVLARWKSGDGMLAGLLARDARLARAAEWMVLRVSWSDSAAERGMHALEILAHEGSIARITPHHHAVLSLNNHSKKYNVIQKRCKWSCDCPDHLHRKAQCKHILAVIYYVVEREEAALGMHDTPPDQDAGNRQDEQPDIHIEEVPEYPEKCIECRGDHIIKWGFTGEGESRRQRYKCKNPECECTFVYRGGFERMRKPVWAILRAFNDFFKGHTPKDVADTLAKGMQIPELEQLMGHAAQGVADAIGKLKCEVDRSSIYRWFAKFIPITHEYMRQIPIRTGEHVAADEVCMSGDDDEDENDAKKSAAAHAQPKESKEPDETLAAGDVHAAHAQPKESKEPDETLAAGDVHAAHAQPKESKEPDETLAAGDVHAAHAQPKESKEPDETLAAGDVHAAHAQPKESKEPDETLAAGDVHAAHAQPKESKEPDETLAAGDVHAAHAQPKESKEPDETLAAGDVHAAHAQPKESKRKKWYLFSTTDILTRFCPAFEMADHKDGFNATNLLKETLRRTGKVPAVFTTDCLPSYIEAHQAVFAAKNPLDKHSVHVSDSCLNNKKKHNNFQERFNGTYRKFQHPRQNIPSPHSPLITGFFVYYNFVRPHSSLNERTPAEAAGVIIHGADKWRTIIGNASLAARAREAGP